MEHSPSSAANSSQPVKKFPAFYGTRRFITAFRRAHHLSRSWICRLFRNTIVFYGKELLAPRPNPKLEDHPLSAVRDCLFNVFATTLHNWRPFLHPLPEDAPSRGDRDPLNTNKHIFMQGRHVSNLPQTTPIWNKQEIKFILMWIISVVLTTN
jgi:hypothetical protein